MTRAPRMAAGLSVLCMVGCGKLLGIESTAVETKCLTRATEAPGTSTRDASSNDRDDPARRAEQACPKTLCPPSTPSDAAIADAPVSCNEAAIEERVFRGRHLWPERNLHVCYRQADKLALEPDETLAFLTRVQGLLAATWQRSAHLNLWFEGECDARSHDLTLLLSRYGNTHVSLGFEGKSVDKTVTLNTLTASDPEIVHALGRALGFEYEYGRSSAREECLACKTDTDCKRVGSKQCLPSGYCGVSAPGESIMAAPECGGWIDPGRVFSAWDAWGATRSYGRKPHGSLVGANGECLALIRSALDTSLATKPCLGHPGDRWDLTMLTSDGAPSVLRTTSAGSDVCATAKTMAATGRPPIVPNSCDDDSQQHARIGEVELRLMGALCVVVPTNTGGALAVEVCDPRPQATRWILAGRNIQKAGTELCLSARDGGPEGSRDLGLAACDPKAIEQQFRLEQAEISLLDGTGEWCMAVQDEHLVEGSPVVLSKGCGLARERSSFHMRAAIEIGGRCLTQASAQPATKLVAEGCSKAAVQVWDYYF